MSRNRAGALQNVDPLAWGLFEYSNPDWFTESDYDDEMPETAEEDVETNDIEEDHDSKDQVPPSSLLTGDAMSAWLEELDIQKQATQHYRRDTWKRLMRLSYLVGASDMELQLLWYETYVMITDYLLELFETIGPTAPVLQEERPLKIDHAKKLSFRSLFLLDQKSIRRVTFYIDAIQESSDCVLKIWSQIPAFVRMSGGRQGRHVAGLKDLHESWLLDSTLLLDTDREEPRELLIDWDDTSTTSACQREVYDFAKTYDVFNLNDIEKASLHEVLGDEDELMVSDSLKMFLESHEFARGLSNEVQAFSTIMAEILKDGGRSIIDHMKWFRRVAKTHKN